jgi:hypothetical protein
MPLGKYERMRLMHVPRPYLRWLRRQEWVGVRLANAIDDILYGGPAGRPETTFDMPWASDPKKVVTFSVRQSGNVGQEILDQDGKIVAWTTDEWVAQAICKLLNENEERLRRKN